MDIYLSVNGTQTGPFTEEQVRQMLQAGLATAQTLAWRQGDAQWQPLSSLVSMPSGMPAPPPLPQPARGSKLGVVSLIWGIVSILAVCLLFYVASTVTNQGGATKDFNTNIGLLVFLWAGLNILALGLGVAGAVVAKSKLVSILGACLNALELAGVCALIALGLWAAGR
jgi:hypothetical protein